jgi:hypothetical protein
MVSWFAGLPALAKPGRGTLILVKGGPAALSSFEHGLGVVPGLLGRRGQRGLQPEPAFCTLEIFGEELSA